MKTTADKIAVIGMSGKFPGANNITEFWNNLVAGKETIAQFSDEELSKYEVDFEELANNPNFVRSRGILENIEQFDASFFGMTPNEASFTDPQHRIWLETAWDAFENANIDPFSYNGAIGVYAGSYINTYLLNNILRDPKRLENFIRLRSTESFQLMTGNDEAFIPTKTAYKFNLKGPAINVQTACSTSLVAIVQACLSLLSCESDVCLAGGVCILNPQVTGYLYQEGAIPSPDGHCRPFDEKAKGTVFSNGIGIVVLKRLDDALRDHDRIYALISGWALNNDGNKKVSYTAPAINGQAEVIVMAQAFAEVSPEDIAYIEAHGTGTQLGDPIEIAALTKAFTYKTNKKQFCGVGSVKSNIGHTDAAAGVASIIKAALSVYNRKIPKSLHYNKPNPFIDFVNSPFYVQSELKEWKEEKPMIIGVSSFGIGGTNAHIIIEEPPLRNPHASVNFNWPTLLILSAKTETSLHLRKEQLKDFLLQNQEESLANIAYTLQLGRNHMTYRSFCITNSVDDFNKGEVNFTDGKTDNTENALTFVFPGQGAQYVNMARNLYENNDEFRNIADSLFDIYKETTGEDIKQIIFSDDTEQGADKLSQTKYTQPSLFVIEYSLAKLFIKHGVIADYLIGHSIGEYAAAAVAGVFTPETALKIVIKRGSLMQNMPKGCMFAVRSSSESLAGLHSNLFELAADNGRNSCTISFKPENLDHVKKLLEERSIGYIALNTSHAFHSSSFDPILKEFAGYVDQFSSNSPRIPFISCLTGKFITESEACSGKYWAQQLRHTVLFDKGIMTITGKGNCLFVEVGPNTHMSQLIKSNKLITNKAGIISTLGKPDSRDDSFKIIEAFGNLWINGYILDFNKIYDHFNSYKITLPGYPFDRKKYWIDHTPGKIVVSPTPVKIKQQNNPHIAEQTAKDNLSGVKQSLKELISELSGYDPNEIQDYIRFEDYGFDSLFLSQFASKVEKKYKITLIFRQLIQDYTNLQKLAEYINSGNEQASMESKTEKISNNLTLIQPLGKKDPFFMVFGVDAFNFDDSCFGKERPFYTYVHLGSDGEPILYESVEQIAKIFLKQLLKVKPQGPYYLGGYSFGGLIVFEMATMLQKMGHQVPGLILIDCKNPALKEPEESFGERIVRKNLVNRIGRRLVNESRLLLNNYYFFTKTPLPVKKRRQYIVASYRRILKNYVPHSFDGNILLIKAAGNHSKQNYLGWENLVNNIDVITLEGNHTNVIKIKNNIKQISKITREYLEKAQKAELVEP